MFRGSPPTAVLRLAASLLVPCFAAVVHAQELEQVTAAEGAHLARVSPDGAFVVGRLVRSTPGGDPLPEVPITWRDGITSILPLPASAYAGAATDSSEAGATIVGWTIYPGQSYTLTVWETNGSIAVLGLPTNRPFDARVSANGLTIVAGERGFVRASRNDPWSPLPILVIIRDVSDDGTLLVGRKGKTACQWRAPFYTPELLGPNLDGTEERSSAGLGVSPDGQTVVGQDGPGEDYSDLSGFAWWDGGHRRVAPESFSYPGFLTNNGGTLVISSPGGWGQIYTPETGSLPLHTYLLERGALTAGLFVTEALDMTSDGRKLLIRARGSDLVERTYFVQLFPESPEIAITGLRMSNSHTVEIRVSATWPHEVGQFEAKCVINNTELSLVRQDDETPGETLYLDLRSNGTDLATGRTTSVPRFRDAQTVRVTVTARAAQGSALASDQFLIPLPAIIVQGLFSTDIGDPEPSDLITALKARGYARVGEDVAYPTLLILGDGFRYKPSFDTLHENANSLRQAILHITSPELTYADCVDLITHSKGGLVSRMYLREHDIEGLTVRKLIMAGTPQTGSPLVALSPLSPRVLKELAPTWPWSRRKAEQSFEVPKNWRNRVLEDLNSRQLPQGIRYYLICGTEHPAVANVTGSWPRIQAGGSEGDGIVTRASQLGYQVVNGADGSVLFGARIPAFRGVSLQEMTMVAEHRGLLNTTRDLILEALTE